MDIRVLMLGDAAFTIEFPDLQGVEGARRVRFLRSLVEDKIEDGSLVGIVDLISATRSLSVCLDPLKADFLKVQGTVVKLAKMPFIETSENAQIWALPACYEGEYAPDLIEMAERSGLSVDEVVKIHTTQVYDILLIGFLPGFPFMAEIPEVLRFPRRTNPRTRVPAGSVAIANNQTAIYPWESPGGWHLLARCPVPLFNPDWGQPSLLSPGGKVSFEPVSEKDFKTLEADLTAGRLDPHSFLDEGKV